MYQINIMTKESAYWEETMLFAEKCSWRAGKYLAEKMKNNSFEPMERVISVCDNGKVVAFSTFARKDELPEKYDFSPFVGFVFVSEEYRGKRISEQMIDTINEYAKQSGYSKLYVMSGELGLYEKYGFRKIGDYDTTYGTVDQLFVRDTGL